MLTGMHDKKKGVLFICIAAFFWSTSFSVTKLLLATVPPLTIGAIRFSLAALILYALMRWRKGPARRGQDIKHSLAAGFVGIFVYFALENVGVEFATASDATLIIASYPVITLIGEVLFRGKRAGLAEVSGMILACVGVYLIAAYGSQSTSALRNWGVLILLLGGVVWATYSLLISTTASRLDPLSATCYQTIAGAVAFTLACPIEAHAWRTLGALDVGLLLYLCLSCSILAFLLYNAGVKYVSSSTAVNILNLVPLFGMVIAVVTLGERPSPIQILGGLIVVVGVYIVSAMDHKANRPLEHQQLARQSSGGLE